MQPVERRFPKIASEIYALFAEREAKTVEIDILQPADPFLDMAGEDLRSRIFLTESETGETLCLRPEFTIPVCRDHIAKQAGTPLRYAYLGEVFRQRRTGGSAFFQAGIEDLGETDRAAADARSIADAHQLVSRLLPKVPLTVTFGDQAIFEAVLEGLGLPRGWQKRLARAFGSPDLLSQSLNDLADNGARTTLDAETARVASTKDALIAHIEKRMAETGLSPSLGRSPQEIATRLSEKLALEKVQLGESQMQALKDFLSLKAPLGEATNAIADFAGKAGLVLNGAFEMFETRIKAMERHGLKRDALIYDAGFGRPLDYYTGLVFEIAPRGGKAVLAGGGRYDRLLTLLGAREEIPGVGFSVWLDRVEALAGETGK
ncbi:ATP phosphoribosyltransferase regulatory subunit [Limoniibacter endophyticus]|uniref:ATP phosphoribosyltransferase regulatory subunit n=1 Tax=Limoniibacter endophyticus TaxID=1565040 RepID=A0A8J3GHR2_9HYPH|nr:ATP phosphoribosyltransferase regulatory subunit [Limoniibacter endophyticus]GHC67777.1 ATP phosphoribosyltransferase regulatory subunit [Limoniibacter endophyticus]